MKILKYLKVLLSVFIVTSFSVPLFAETLIGVSWRHFQEERWRIDEAGIKDMLEELGGDYKYISADAQSDPWPLQT